MQGTVLDTRMQPIVSDEGTAPPPDLKGMFTAINQEALRQDLIGTLMEDYLDSLVIPTVIMQGEVSTTPHGIPQPGKISIHNFDKPLESVFAMADESTHKQVNLVIETPGGSPAEAKAIAEKIRSLKAMYPDVQVTVFTYGVNASAGMMISSAADEIVADSMAQVGSIGVISQWAEGHEADDRRKGIRIHTLTTSDQKRPTGQMQMLISQQRISGLYDDFCAMMWDSRGDTITKRCVEDFDFFRQKSFELRHMQLLAAK